MKSGEVIAENERGSCVWEIKGRGYSALSWKLCWESEGLAGLSSTWISGILVSMVMLVKSLPQPLHIGIPLATQFKTSNYCHNYVSSLAFHVATSSKCLITSLMCYLVFLTLCPIKHQKCQWLEEEHAKL